MSKASSLGALALCLLLQACVHTPTGDEPQRVSVSADIEVVRHGSTLRYSGELTKSGFDALRSLAQGQLIQSLEITSSGGEINAGMDFGEWVHARGLSVVVPLYCLSACANYVFTAGWQKILSAGAVVAWHGSARQRDLPDQLVQVVDDQVQALSISTTARDRERARRRQAADEYLRQAIARQDVFFRRISVSEYVTRIGQERYGMDGFYSLSLTDMARFGILNVSAYPEYDDVKTVMAPQDVKVVRLRLESAQALAPR